jgi:hypothetical protein
VYNPAPELLAHQQIDWHNYIMRYRKLDNNGDMTFGNQQADFYRDIPEAPAQAVLTRLRLWLGEWFLDQTQGTPYTQAVLGMHTQNTVDPVMRSQILNTTGVTDIVSYESLRDPDNRKLTINATINTLYGVTTVQGVL